ncbi:MAG: dipeptidase [Terriglobia bacterium]
MIVIDAHLDLSWNALNWNRDLTLPVEEIRRLEAGMNAKNRGTNTVSFPELRRAEVAVCLATVLSRASRRNDDKLDYRNQEIAYAMAQGQLAYYRVMEAQGQLRMLRDWPSLLAHITNWKGEKNQSASLGFILSMEGADPIVSPDQTRQWWDDGLRVVGLAHYGVSAYAHGTAAAGGLTGKGQDLLKAMDETGMILDVTHLADDSFWQAVKLFQGPVLASHNNCRALVPDDRQFSDDQIRYLIERDAVIGAAFDAWMLYPGWVRGETSNSVVGIEAVVDHIDHVCQLAGNARHSAIGSDLDGGFGTEQCPHGLDTIVDLQQIPGLLAKRGYSDGEVEGIMHGNWLRFFEKAWTKPR